MKLVGHVGGNLNNGANAGLSYLSVLTSASNRYWPFGARVRTYFAYISLSLPLGKINNNTPFGLVKAENSGVNKRLKNNMKRIDDLFIKIIDKDNLRLAHQNARKGKKHYSEVKKVDKNIDKYIDDLHFLLKNKTFKNSEYEIFERNCNGKIRVIYKLPYYPDRIIQHAILQVLEPIWRKVYIRDTYQSIKGRGVHLAKRRIEKVLRKEKPKYCLKIDIHKFYPSVDNEILKKIIRKKIKCRDTLWLLDEIIDSVEGLPIGNYISQTFGNLYLTYFDHHFKEKFKLKNYYRYCDDVIILHNNKQYLNTVLSAIKIYLKTNLKLELKPNYQVFPISARPIDFLGYKFYLTHTLIRNSIKRAFIRKTKSYIKTHSKHSLRSLASYYGWLKHANAHNLLTKYLENYESIIKCKKTSV